MFGRPSRSHGKHRKQSRFTLWLIRVVALIVALQFAGVVHPLLDAARSLELAASEGEEQSCPFEERGDLCPPGCPSCHCVQPAVAIAPAPIAVIAAVGFSEDTTFGPQDDRGPLHGVPRSVYRPPRHV